MNGKKQHIHLPLANQEFHCLSMLQRDTEAFLYLLQLCELQLHLVHFFEDCHLPLPHQIACELSHPEENKKCRHLK